MNKGINLYMKEYKNYTVDSFLKDSDFIRYLLLDNEEDRLYWREVIIKNPDLEIIANEAKDIFIGSVRLNNYVLDERVIDEEVDKLIDRIRLLKKKKHNRRITQIISIAASSAIIIVATLFFYSNNFNNKKTKPLDIEQARLVAVNDILLIARDTTIIVEENTQISQQDFSYAQQSQQQSTITSKKEKPHINKLIVPYGKRSSLVLADGSKIWINSGSVVEFPTWFDDEVRTITVDGEIYIEVAKKEEQKFIVKTSVFDIDVLGTSFDISAYSEDKTHSVILVEGQINIVKDGILTKIKPDQQYFLEGNEATVREVDVDDYTSWRYGWIQVKSFTLEEITMKLSRYYNTKIICEPDVSERRASGKLRLFENLEDVLDILSKNMKIEYSQEGNSILLHD